MTKLESDAGDLEGPQHLTVSREAVVTVLEVLRRAIEETKNFEANFGPDDSFYETFIAHCQEFIDALDDADRIVIAPAEEIEPVA